MITPGSLTIAPDAAEVLAERLLARNTPSLAAGLEAGCQSEKATLALHCTIYLADGPEPASVLLRAAALVAARFEST